MNGRLVDFLFYACVVILLVSAGYFWGEVSGAIEAADLIDQNFVCQPRR